MKKLRYLGLLAMGLLFFVTSCSDEQDFSQIDDLNITPTISSGLFYFESDEETINTAGALSTFYSREATFNAFSERFVAEHVLEGSIGYVIENTTSKEIQIAIQFLNDDGRVLDTEIFDIEADPSGILTREVFYGTGGKSLDILVNTTGFRILARNLGDGTSESSTQDSKIILQSGGEFLFELQ
ncbi:hypothetical protein [Allomuricauda sp. F6463D]|uniref:hypothetical protein n=1 Tax=Allomuricauda sp. F6463D TaxID=2926409 RepID=UPI001FF5137F|nr:hypothetical protein [Muricauda sp. F6463D]MCK0160649.1 hypothetical protein [Muricauda sp. F6463D]